LAQRKKGDRKRAKTEMKQDSGQIKEKVFHTRKYPRVPLAMDVEYQSGERFVSGQSHDIGHGGMFIKSESPLGDGLNTKIRFVMDKEREVVEVEGRVAWTNKGQERKRETLPKGMGIEFVESNQEKRKLIHDFVRDLTDLMRIMAITNKRRES